MTLAFWNTLLLQPQDLGFGTMETRFKTRFKGEAVWKDVDQRNRNRRSKTPGGDFLRLVLEFMASADNRSKMDQRVPKGPTRKWLKTFGERFSFLANLHQNSSASTPRSTRPPRSTSNPRVGKAGPTALTRP